MEHKRNVFIFTINVLRGMIKKIPVHIKAGIKILKIVYPSTHTNLTGHNEFYIVPVRLYKVKS